MNYTIPMPEQANYLSDFMEKLPTGIFNKKVTATGATTLVLENPYNTILVSPTNNLIRNKMKQYPNERCSYKLFAVNGGVTTHQVKQYVRDCTGVQPVKFISTPDSLWKITDHVENVFEDYQFIVDEFHEIIKMTSEREAAALNLLSVFSKFKEYTFLSATPLKEDFLPDPLNSLDYYTLELTNFEKLRVTPSQTAKPFNAVVDLITNTKMQGGFKIEDKTSKHLYFFINSVSGMCNIIKSAGITQKDVNIICADNNHNRKNLAKVGCAIGEFLTEPELKENPEREAMFHFISSTAFQGSDVYSNDGTVFLISNCHEKNTLSGMATLQQISGRIRTKTNPFRGVIFHIFNVNKAALSMGEFLKEQQEQIDESNGIINDWRGISEGSRNAIRLTLDNADLFGKSFYHYEALDGTMKLNELKIKADQYTHQVENLIYTTGIDVRRAYAEEGFDSEAIEYYRAESALKQAVEHQDFKAYVDTYHQSKQVFCTDAEPLFGCPKITQKLIELAYNELGYETIKELKYHQTSIKERLKLATNFNFYGTMKAAHRTFKEGERYPKTFVKESLQAIYDRQGCGKTAKATDIGDYFEYQERTLSDDKKGIMIIRKINNEVIRQEVSRPIEKQGVLFK
jgi:hypothetical protein